MNNCTGIRCILQAGTVDPATCDCVSYCQYATPPKTNADRIRAMTDEELAEYVFELANYACPPEKTYAQLTCGKNPKCSDCWLEWLRQEAT